MTAHFYVRRSPTSNRKADMPKRKPVESIPVLVSGVIRLSNGRFRAIVNGVGARGEMFEADGRYPSQATKRAIKKWSRGA